MGLIFFCQRERQEKMKSFLSAQRGAESVCVRARVRARVRESADPIGCVCERERASKRERERTALHFLATMRRSLVRWTVPQERPEMNLTPMGGKEEEEADYFQSGFHDKTETNGKVLLLALLQLTLKKKSLFRSQSI